MEETLQEHEIAARELRKLCEEIEIEARPLGKEGHQLRFFCTLKRHGVTIETRYGAGVGIAHAWAAKLEGESFSRVFGFGHGFGGHRDQLRKALTKPGSLTLAEKDVQDRSEVAYRPSAFEVVSCLLSDQASIEPYTDWMDWAEDLGWIDGKAESVRKARDSYHEIQSQTAKLKAMFLRYYEQAKNLSTQL